MLTSRILIWVCAGMAVALVVMFWRANAISNDRDRYRDALSSERAQHGVTRASLNILESELGNMVREGVLREDRLERALAVQASKRVALGITDGARPSEVEKWRVSDTEMINVMTSEDAMEGPRAFAEKRAPVWKVR